ncbi:unnamed protein product [Linum tenue]|uniref:DUF4378 domain-containing protein n=1 Tax=Linum tenue TaxID=586396 RepID=A0AAV0P191_9ROSI|nr:unnamed protein product [Linum tenue]
MAAADSQVKQLRQILQEQQEPFVLKTYLVEKGCCIRSNSLEQEGSFTCCRVTSGKKGQKGVSHLSKVVRNLCDQVGSINGKKLKRKKKKKKQKQSPEAEEERLSFASCSSKNFIWFSSEGDNVEGRASCSSSFADFCNSNEEKVNNQIAADGSLQWRCMEDEDQHSSPVSVLEGPASQEEDSSSPPTKNSSSSSEVIIRKKKEEKPNQVSVDESIIASASVWGVLLQRAMARAEATETGDPLKSSSLELEKTKKQLLFDCIQEEMELETHYSRMQSCTSSARIMRPQAWSRTCKTGGGFELLSDSLAQREWSDDGEQCREIGQEIADAILEEIKDEIMVDLTGP